MAKSKAQLWREAAVQLARRQRTRGLLEEMAQQEVNRRLRQEIARRQQHVSNRLICTGFHRILYHFRKCVQIKFHSNPKRGDGTVSRARNYTREREFDLAKVRES